MRKLELKNLNKKLKLKTDIIKIVKLKTEIENWKIEVEKLELKIVKLKLKNCN